MNAVNNRRASVNRPLRSVILAGNLLATLIEQVGPNQETPFGRSLDAALAAWEHAVEIVRQEEEARHD